MQKIVVKYIKENKKILLLILAIVVVLSIITIFMDKADSNKIYKSESYIYTKETHNHEDNITSELPYINVKNDRINDINVILIDKYYEIITVDDKFMKYNSYINDNILSLIVRIYYQESPDSYPDEVLIYNVDIDNGELLTNQELLNMFGISRNSVTEIIMNDLKEYYKYELEKGYINKECNFDCYLSLTESMPILDDCNYYVRDNELYAYKSISLGSAFFYDINSGFNLFNFKITD